MPKLSGLERLRVLTTVMLKQCFRSRRRHTQFDQERDDAQKVLMFIVVPIVGVLVVGQLYNLFRTIASTGQVYGQRELALVVAASVIMLFLFVTGVFLVFSHVLFSGDLSILLPLPLTNGEIVIAKLAPVIITQYLIAAILYLPALLAVGGSGVLWWLMVFLIFIFLPVLPLTLAGIVAEGAKVLVPARLLRGFAYLGGALGLIIQVSFNYYLRRGAVENAAKLLTANPDLVSMAARGFPPAAWVARALSGGGSQYLLLFIGFSVLGAYSLYHLANYSVHKTMVNLPHRKSQGAARLSHRGRGVLWALYIKEWKTLLGDPIAMNMVLRSMVAALLFLFPSMTGSITMMGDYMLASALLGVAIVFSSNNMVAGTAISREGRRFYISKCSPISGCDYVSSKLVHAHSVSAVTALLYATAFALVLKLPVIYVLGTSLCAVAALFYLNAVFLRNDLCDPNLEWQTSGELYRKGTAPFLWTVGVVVASLGVGRLIQGWGPLLMYTVILVLLSSLACWAWRQLRAEANTRYEAIEF